METVVVALGGNALLQPGQQGTFAEQMANIATITGPIRSILAAGFRVVITHGNGPQVGNILIQNETATDIVPALPLDAIGAESQGLLGYMLAVALRSELRSSGLEHEIVALVTMSTVDPADPAFAQPVKPVGPCYTAERARMLMAQNGYVMREDSGRGWRRVVASPEPLSIVETPVIRRLVDAGIVVVATGGGGIPVRAAPDSRLHGVEAVIDKDLAAARLAGSLDADVLLILTDVPAVALNYGTADRIDLTGAVPVAAMEQYLAAGHFARGSMAPKVQAAVRFVRGRTVPSRRAIIARIDAVAAALRGEAGTCILSGAPVPE